MKLTDKRVQHAKFGALLILSFFTTSERGGCCILFLSRFICLFTWGLGEGVDGEKLVTGRYRHGFKLAESVPIYAFAECILMEMILDWGGVEK